MNTFFQLVTNIVGTKCVHFESVHFDNQLLSTANAKDIKTDYYITKSFLTSKYHRSVA